MPSLYHLERIQFLPISLSEAWEFFSTPDNLSELTPSYLRMEIKTRSGTKKIYSGQIIRYRLKPFLGIPLSWVTEITHMKDQVYFVDEQRFGPYAFWHHTHFFKEVPGGVEIRDLVHYRLPMGPFGRWVHYLFIGKQLKEIFEFRRKYLDTRFLDRPREL